MKCRRAQKYISEYVDGILGSALEKSLKSHLEGCSDCRAFLDDFRTIAGEAGRLEKLIPPDRVWTDIRMQLREKRSAAHVEESERWRLFPLLPSRLHFAVASAMGILLLMVLGAIYFQPWNRGLPPESAAVDRQTLEKIDEAEWYYQQAIQALSEAVEGQEGDLAPEVAEVFRANLEIVDASLEACRKAVRRAPRDLDAKYALLESYKQKVQLLTDWVLIQQPAESEERKINS
ncbi:MAG: zf-HC2 domain-containing protein [Candidatus Eiseniibacteriota bacterium]|nr:MAG: zf-HC2 domain-containing protein [Candidatus Eisenbacteria bacterium]